MLKKKGRGVHVKQSEANKEGGNKWVKNWEF